MDSDTTCTKARIDPPVTKGRNRQHGNSYTLTQRKLPHRLRERSGDYNPGADAIQVMTMKVSKGLEFPVVALSGVGHLPAPGEDEKDAARVFCGAATPRLVTGVGGSGALGRRRDTGAD